MAQPSSFGEPAGLLEQLWTEVVAAEQERVEATLVGALWGELVATDQAKTAEEEAQAEEQDVVERMWADMAESELDAFLSGAGCPAGHAEVVVGKTAATERCMRVAKCARRARWKGMRAVARTLSSEEHQAACDELPLALVPQTERARATGFLKRREMEYVGHTCARRAVAALATEGESTAARAARKAAARLREERRMMVAEEAAATQREGTDRRATAQARQTKRATELLTQEKALAAAKAGVVAAEAEHARAVQQRQVYGRLDHCGQLAGRVCDAEAGLAAAAGRLEKARVAAALATNTGWAANTATRQLAAARALRGGRLPREVRAQVGHRVATWQRPEDKKARARRAERDDKERKRAAGAALHTERQRMLAADAAARVANKTWRRQAQCKKKRRAADAFWERQSAVRNRLRDNERGRLEAAADTELQQKRQQQRAGAGRRCDGPAVKALKAFMIAQQRGAALPRTKVAPRRAPCREEVRDSLNGTVTWWDGRAANEKGYVQSFLPSDEVTEAWSEEGASSEEADHWAGEAACEAVASAPDAALGKAGDDAVSSHAGAWGGGAAYENFSDAGSDAGALSGSEAGDRGAAFAWPCGDAGAEGAGASDEEEEALERAKERAAELREAHQEGWADEARATTTHVCAGGN